MGGYSRAIVGVVQRLGDLLVLAFERRTRCEGHMGLHGASNSTAGTTQRGRSTCTRVLPQLSADPRNNSSRCDYIPMTHYLSVWGHRLRPTNKVKISGEYAQLQTAIMCSNSRVGSTTNLPSSTTLPLLVFRVPEDHRVYVVIQRNTKFDFFTCFP